MAIWVTYQKKGESKTSYYDVCFDKLVPFIETLNELDNDNKVYNIEVNINGEELSRVFWRRYYID